MAIILYESCVALIPFVMIASILLYNGLVKETVRIMKLGFCAYAVFVLGTAMIVQATLTRHGSTLSCCVLKTKRTWVWDGGISV